MESCLGFPRMMLSGEGVWPSSDLIVGCIRFWCPILTPSSQGQEAFVPRISCTVAELCSDWDPGSWRGWVKGKSERPRLVGETPSKPELLSILAEVRKSLYLKMSQERPEGSDGERLEAPGEGGGGAASGEDAVRALSWEPHSVPSALWPRSQFTPKQPHVVDLLPTAPLDR